MVLSTRAFYSGLLGPVCWGVGPSWIRPDPARSDWDLGNLEAQSTPWALYCVPSGSVVVMRGCTWSSTVFG